MPRTRIRIRTRPRRRSFAALLLALVLLGAACGDEGIEPSTGGSPSVEPSTPAPSTPDASPTEDDEPSATMTLEVWFQQGDKLFVTSRTVPKSPAPGRAALEQLLSGPTVGETDAALGTSIPEGTELLGLAIDGGIATVDLSDAYDDGGGSASMFMRLAQVVFTLTQFPTVEGVEFRLEGDPVETFSGEGIVLDRPQRRKHYEDQMPAITVSSPQIGDRVSSPMLVEGTANTFEATVSIRIVTEGGEVLTEAFTTATCGTGCRGDYTTKVRFKVDSETEAVLEVFESSAEDGSATKIVRVPVTLVP